MVVDEILSIVKETLTEDYPTCFRERFRAAAAIREKILPFRAVEDVRNTMDHFSLALQRAAERDVPGWVAPPPAATPLEEANRDPYVQVWRGRRHLAAAEFQSVYYIATTCMDESQKVLESDFAADEADYDELCETFDRLSKRLGQISPPKDGGMNTVAANQEEISRIQDERDKMEELIEPIYALYRRTQSIGSDRARL